MCRCRVRAWAGPRLRVCFITAGPITKLFAWGEEDSGGHVLRETTSRGLCVLVCPSRTEKWFLFTNKGVCFITAGPFTKLFAWGRERVEDMCYERRRAEACMTSLPITH